jgi:tRNA-Thr(GGU) m(6)t(6)A37 methyltransferase TsaA
MKIIARIYTDFKEKFGIPRQSGIVKNTARIVFEPEYRVDEARRGIEGYSHLWIIWKFSEAELSEWSPTVRPPRLGGNKRMGVFATRSPYRPNPIGLSSIELIRIEKTKALGTTLIVRGADMLDGTPIYDIKPYLAYTDSHPEAVGGFSDGVLGYRTEVEIPQQYQEMLSECELSEIKALLEHDPRPSYKGDSMREYGMIYGNHEIFFKGLGGKLTVTRIEKRR